MILSLMLKGLYVKTHSVKQLLQLLDAEQYHSGEWLGEKLGITRAGVWKQLKLLEELGVAVESKHRHGYRLRQPVDLLDKNLILSALPPAMASNIALTTHLTVDSTNTVVKDKVSQCEYTVCVADHQSAGRGRQGRFWQSPLGSNCYYSLLWKTEYGFASLEGLSLVMGLALTKVLEKQNVTGLHLKWPNDILWNGKKVAGILVEVDGDIYGSCQVIVGVGVNLFLPKKVREKIDQPVEDLTSILGKHLNKNILVANLTEEIVNHLKVFDDVGFKGYQNEWNHYAAYLGERVVLQAGSLKVVGICQGVNKQGNLLIEVDGEIKAFSGGELSLRGYETVFNRIDLDKTIDNGG